MKKVICLIYAFILCALLLCSFIFYYTRSDIISDKIDDWQAYGQTLYSWLGLCLMVINILIVILLNDSVKILSKNLNQKSIEAEKEKLKAQLRYDNYVKFKEKWENAYTVLQNNANNNNQQYFDKFKEIYNKYISNDKFLEKSIIQLEIVAWWNNKLKSIEDIYKTNADFNANNASIEMSPKIQELFMDLATNIFEYAQEEKSKPDSKNGNCLVFKKKYFRNLFR